MEKYICILLQGDCFYVRVISMVHNPSFVFSLFSLSIQFFYFLLITSSHFKYSHTSSIFSQLYFFLQIFKPSLQNSPSLFPQFFPLPLRINSYPSSLHFPEKVCIAPFFIFSCYFLFGVISEMVKYFSAALLCLLEWKMREWHLI